MKLPGAPIPFAGSMLGAARHVCESFHSTAESKISFGTEAIYHAS